MSKERLGEIENENTIKMTLEQYGKLLGKANHVQELEQENDNLRKIIKELEVELNYVRVTKGQLSVRNKELEKELGIYKNIARNNKRTGEFMLHEINKENRKLIKENEFLNERRLHHKKQNKRYRKALKGVLDITVNENWSKYEAIALQDSINDFITLKNSDLLEESEC